MHRLIAEEVSVIYRLAWSGDLPTEEIAVEYSVSKAHISAIKHGRIWSYVTGHQRDSIAHISFEQKKAFLLKNHEAAIVIDDIFWDLFDEFGQDVAKNFKQRIYEIRCLSKLKLAVNEIQEIYNQFRKQD